jgi:hypothetical protein
MIFLSGMFAMSVEEACPVIDDELRRQQTERRFKAAISG